MKPRQNSIDLPDTYTSFVSEIHSICANMEKLVQEQEEIGRGIRASRTFLQDQLMILAYRAKECVERLDDLYPSELLGYHHD